VWHATVFRSYCRNGDAASAGQAASKVVPRGVRRPNASLVEVGQGWAGKTPGGGGHGGRVGEGRMAGGGFD